MDFQTRKRKLSESYSDIEEEVSKQYNAKRFKEGEPETYQDHSPVVGHYSTLNIDSSSVSVPLQQNIQHLQQQASGQSQQQFGAGALVMSDDQVRVSLEFFQRLPVPLFQQSVIPMDISGVQTVLQLIDACLQTIQRYEQDLENVFQTSERGVAVQRYIYILYSLHFL